jgi:transcription elongation factor Elf1
MGKRQKREAKNAARRAKSLDKAFQESMGATSRKCPKCGNSVHIPPIDSWAVCSCGKMVSRFD